MNKSDSIIGVVEDEDVARDFCALNNDFYYIEREVGKPAYDFFEKTKYLY